MRPLEEIKPLKIFHALQLAFLIIVLLSLTSCSMHMTKPYADSAIDPVDRAALTFTTHTLGKSYGYFGLIRRLRLEVYEMQLNNSSRQYEPKEYLGTIWITNEENSKTIPIPSGKTLGLLADYYQIFLNMYTKCITRTILSAKRGNSYTLEYSKDDKKCWASITPVESGPQLVTVNTSTIIESDHKEAIPAGRSDH